MKKDLIASALLLAVAALYYAATVRIPVSTLADEVGPHGLPTVLAIALAIVGVSLGVRALTAKRSLAAAGDDEEEREATPLRALGLLGIGALYIPVAWVLGYVPALVLLILGVALYEGMRPSMRMIAIAVGGAALFWVLFVLLLGAPQPNGMFF